MDWWGWLIVSVAYCLVGTGFAIGLDDENEKGRFNPLTFLALVVVWFPLLLVMLGLVLVDRLLDS